MTKSATQYIINASEDGITVKVDFARHHQDKQPCLHHNVSFNRRDDELTCLTCGAKVNPVAWIADHAEQIHRQATRPPKPLKPMS